MPFTYQLMELLSHVFSAPFCKKSLLDDGNLHMYVPT